ncbi:DUF6644 family protein [Sphingobium nicotianae]|uniref:DUF6644 domain-containing protein n=1 Tax=Sphingobium nicotianae TaxID=2782607 RepID=A0A9X1DDJ3_9SPHN|nr:DUF6644 family protein [Sphingobium nicotianae]MBT2188192.1 hypothetical protein [Sphingobium nicotianae]
MLDAWIKPKIDWLNAQPFQQTIRYTEWVVPTMQTIHIIAVAFVMTAALIVALRGIELVGTEWSVARWYQRFHASTIAALWVLLGTGTILTLAEPERELLNWVFRTKMVMVVITLVLAHLLGRRLRTLQPGQKAPGGVRLFAVIILLCWIGIACCGRWIAYAG